MTRANSSGAGAGQRRFQRGLESGSPVRVPKPAPATGLGAAFDALAFAGISFLVEVALRIHFRHIRVLHAGRCPARGAVLLVANHPCTWTDAAILDLAVHRRLHFIANESLFHPWARARFLEIYGALPILSRGTTSDHRAHNQRIFDRCEALFDRGAAVAMFPEGVSVGDRELLPLRPGAARLALDYQLRRGGAAALSLIPVGLHYSNRVAFRSDITVNVGDAIDLADLGTAAAADLEAAAHVLTARIDGALRGLIVDLPRPDLAPLVAELEPLAPGDGSNVEALRAMVAGLDQLGRADPARLEALRRRARAYGRARTALRVSDAAVSRHRRRTRLEGPVSAALFAFAGAAPALVGALIHSGPAALARRATRRLPHDASQVSLVRIVAGAFYFAAAYVALLAVVIALAGLRWTWLAAITAVAVGSGVVALHYGEWLISGWGAWRLEWAAHRHPRLVERALANRRVLLEAARLLAKQAAPPPSGAGRPGPA